MPCCLAKDMQAKDCGIKELLTWNKSCITRSIFELATGRPSLWSTWIHAYRLGSESIWDYNTKKVDCWCWNSIIKIRDELTELHTPDVLLALMATSDGKYSTKNVYDALQNPIMPLS